MQEITLKNIDELIENSDKYNSAEKYLIELANLIIPFWGIDLEITNYQSLINRELEQSKKRFIAFCLLRVYGKNPDLLRTFTVKHNIHKFFEQTIPDIIKQLKITSKTETYEIESRLTSYIKEKEKSFSVKVNTDIDLHFIKKYRNSYRSEIKQKKNNPVFWQFFGYKIDGQLFDNVFDILIEYNDSELINKYIIYNKAIDILDNIIELSNETSTKYSLQYISKPFSLIKEKLDDDFKKNPYSKPAKLKIKKTLKKYPFSKNTNYKIQLLIENSSTGYANDAIVKITLYSDDIIKLKQTEQFVGHIKASSIVEFDYIGLSNSEDVLLYGYIEWTNFDRKKCKTEFELDLSGQKLDIDWSAIENEEPYDLEPVTDENEFIGRKKIIDDLKRIRKKVGSSYVFGQRRVGKTSIVKTLQSIINSDDILVIYIEAGDWDSATSPHKSMGDLGKKICAKIKRHNKKFRSLIIPEFEGSFNRLTDFLDEISEIDNTFRVIIILDEFDRISHELLYSGNIAKSFMLTIRAISNREQFGFILVGGEKLEYILSQWQEFNKFKPIRVDYFDKETEWADFKNLVKYPIENILEISDKAIDYIYKQTSGNPYFTKKICVELFSLMISNRDNHITEDEAKKATGIARDSNNHSCN
ncbi:MAG: ATP-binding protein [Bacteroidales bacterium]|nr:ATP-binding protein [Bacteroidales bacterium]